MTNIFAKLGLERTSDDHRRVLAVLAYLRGESRATHRLPAPAVPLAARHDLQSA